MTTKRNKPTIFPCCVWCTRPFISNIGSRLCGRCREMQAANRKHVEGHT